MGGIFVFFHVASFKQVWYDLPHGKKDELVVPGLSWKCVARGNTESRAIAKYLVEKFNITYLVGKSLRERAIINQWIESESQNFHPAVSPVIREMFMSRVFKRPVDEKLISSSLENLGKVLDVYEAHLSKNKYLAGDNYSLADAFHTPYTAKAKNMAVFAGVFEKCPHVQAWVDDITSKPAFVKCTQMNWANAKPLQ